MTRVTLYTTIYIILAFIITVGTARECSASVSSCNESPPTITDCANAKLYSAPDDCGCLHWYCDQLSSTDIQSVCPPGWNRYVNSNGTTICIKMFTDTSPWDQASWVCNGEYNSDLLNIRQIEKLTKGSAIFTSILQDLQTSTQKDRFWCGLHVKEGKLYWDGDVPIPDRDGTSDRYSGYRFSDSHSLVKFLPTHWHAIEIGRKCMSYEASSFKSTVSQAYLNPEYCNSGFPFICSKIVPASTSEYYKPHQGFICSDMPGWKGSLNSGYCYKYFADLLPYAEAKQVCEDNGGHLADPRSLTNQRFLSGVLADLANGTAPLAVHVGMRQDSGVTNFSWGGQLRTSNDLQGAHIYGTPDSSKQCGIFWNPYYAEGRSKVDAVDFSSCSTPRPFICSSSLKGQLSKEPKLRIKMDGKTLECKSDGVDVNGKFIWKKDDQYFPNQPYTANITLDINTYRYVTDDYSNSTITHGDISGQYMCEFWQTYPKAVYRSDEFFVTFNDSLNLRLSADLPTIRWNEDFEGYNYRVRHSDELTENIQIIQNLLQSKVKSQLDPLDCRTLEYKVNILSLRESASKTLVAEYRVQLTGDDVLQSQTNRTASNDTDVLVQVINALTGEQTDATSNSSTIVGQYLCLAREFNHPETRQKLMLPYSINDQVASASGECHGEFQEMITARCVYNRKLRKSNWEDVKFQSCKTDCLATKYSHPITFDVYEIPTGVVNGKINLHGMCGNREQHMVIGTCSNTGWLVRALPCVLSCPPLQLEHPQWPHRVPREEMDVGDTYSLSMVCSKQNKTVLTAKCQRDGDKTIWNVTHTETCDLYCPEQNVSHITGLEWTFPRSFVNTSLTQRGLCNGNDAVLVTAMCNGNIADGVSWSIRKAPCDVKCQPKVFTHPDTLELITLNSGPMEAAVDVTVRCNGEPMIVKAECQGNLTNGLDWHLTSLPNCTAQCPETTRFDPFTDRDYTIPSTDFQSHAAIKGYCGGIEKTIFLAECSGNLSTGVLWNYETFNCTPTCDVTNITHPDILTDYALPNRLFGEKYTIEGLCNGVKEVLVEATCGSDIKDEPKWTDIYFKPCIGLCPSSFFTIQETGEHVRLPDGEIGANFTKDGVCAGLNFTQVEARCVGDAENGGTWRTRVSMCTIDDSCPESSYAQIYTMEKLLVPKSNPGETVEVEGLCEGEKMVMLTATCEPRTGTNGQWSLNYTDCSVDELSQLSNLMKDFYDNPKELARLTGKLSENITKPSAQLVSTMTGIVEHIADPETPKSVEQEGGFYFDIINNMMSFNESALSSSGANESESSSNRLAQSVEGFLETASLGDSKAKLFRKNLIIQALNTSLIDESEPAQLVTEDAIVTLSRNITKDSKVTFVKYSSSVLFGESSDLLGDTVFSAKVADKEVKDVDSAITFTIKLPENGTSGRPVCVYWNFTSTSWSSEGCELIGRDNTSITCRCVHLTNFAILMDAQGQEEYLTAEHHIALSVISMTGLCISIICLSLHLIAFVFIKKLRENQFQKVLANLVLSILISDIVFVSGVTETSNEYACIAVAALLHYFILVSFVWMFVEALMQYRRFVKVFATHVTHILIKAGLPAWLGPLIPVVIIFIVDPQLYRGGSKFCWMKPEALYYAFMLPVGCIIVANIILFSLILRGLLCNRSKTQLRTNKSESQLRNMYFKAALAVFTLLGLTWVFGFLSLSQSSRLVFHYLFCITNAFQGLTIFLLHNIRDPKVISWWRQLLRLKTKQVKSETSKTGSRNVTTNSYITDDSFSTVKSTKPLTTNASVKQDTLDVPVIKCQADINKHGHLLQTKMYSSTESDASCRSAATNTSDV